MMRELSVPSAAINAGVAFYCAASGQAATGAVFCGLAVFSAIIALQPK